MITKLLVANRGEIATFDRSLASQANPDADRRRRDAVDRARPGSAGTVNRVAVSRTAQVEAGDLLVVLT